jgi:hypothetical protein
MKHCEHIPPFSRVILMFRTHGLKEKFSVASAKKLKIQLEETRDPEEARRNPVGALVFLSFFRVRQWQSVQPVKIRD